MNKRNRSIRARLSSAEYRKLVNMADRAGVTQSEFIRLLISQENDISRFEEAISEVKNLLDSATEQNGDDEPLLTEILLLVRELVSDKNAQMLARVNYTLDEKFGNNRRRL